MEYCQTAFLLGANYGAVQIPVPDTRVRAAGECDLQGLPAGILPTAKQISNSLVFIRSYRTPKNL
jgi:hypothetical protein